MEDPPIASIAKPISRAEHSTSGKARSSCRFRRYSRYHRRFVSKKETRKQETIADNRQAFCVSPSPNIQILKESRNNMRLGDSRREVKDRIYRTAVGTRSNSSMRVLSLSLSLSLALANAGIDDNAKTIARARKRSLRLSHPFLIKLS